VKLLIVDDLVDNLELHEIYAERYNITDVEYFTRADEKLKEALLTNEATHVVVDRQMPGVDGDVFLSDFLSKHAVKAKFFLFSAHVEPITHQKLKPFGVTIIDDKSFKDLFKLLEADLKCKNCSNCSC
jgi:response regulator RpfG family c-di-GMP phosphodiesterase